MKKIIALFLVLATLVPMALVANAEPAASAEPFDVSPFIMLNWDSVPEGKFDNVLNSPFFWTAERVDFKISWNGASTPKDLAVKTKELFDTYPVGSRLIKFGFPPRVYMMGYMENYVYLDKGVDLLKAWFEEFLAEFKAIGGEMDGVYLDTEIVDMNAYYLSQKVTKGDTLLYSKIVNDPRYATDIRPLLVERDFPFYESTNDYTPEIYSISNNLSGTKYSEARAIWDRVMRNRLADYLDECVCQPLWKYYPGALVSDYQSADRAGWYKFLSDTGDNSFGELTASGGSAVKVGNSSNHNVYHSRPSSNFYKNSKNEYVYKNPYSYYEAIYEKSPFNMALWEINQFKNIYASTDTKILSAWLTSYNYGIEEGGSAFTPYTTEIVYHLGMLNPQPFLGYVVASEVPEVPYLDRLSVISEQLHELTRVAGFSDRKVIEVPANWNDSYLLSGMYAGGRNIWRLTPDTTKIGLEHFKVSGEGEDLAFRVGGKTITFPGGKIIADTPITTVGSCGYWIETAKDVTPIVTNESYRYEQYPSLLIDFENLAAGKFDYNSCYPIGAWELTWNKKVASSTTVVSSGDGKALEIVGTVAMKSIKLPANITAGDTYAKDQSWEVQVTIPEGLSADAEINLLGYAGAKQKAEDGGFKIQGGKLYYSRLNAEGTGPEYVEMMDITPGTYTLKRTMNFHGTDLFGSTYYVFGGGEFLALAENVAVPVFNSITSINFITKNVDKALLLDNYRITLTGAAADFELYDAKTGVPVKDMTAARDSATAYRLSWLNASGEEKTATVMAAIYENGTLKEEKAIQTVKMQPGYDNVDVGIVDVAAGQTLKLYLVTDIKAPDVQLQLPAPSAAPTEPSTEGTTPVESTAPVAAPGESISTGTLILLVVAVLVAAGGVTVALNVTNKKKK